MDRHLKSILMETEAGREYLRKETAGKRARSARRSSRSPRAPGVDKAAKREERSERARLIRAAVFARAGTRCECCRSRTPAEWHHLISGGARRHAESVETTAAVCAWCHVDLHKNKWHALAAMRMWAHEHSYHDALVAIVRRMDKLPEPTGPASNGCRYGALVCTHAQCQGETTP